MDTQNESTEVLEQESQVEDAEQPETGAEETEEVEGEQEADPGQSEEETEGEQAEGDESEEGEEEGYKPDLSFKCTVYNKEKKTSEQKEFSIDPKFAAIMTDPESAKMVRELHEKATGIDTVKERLSDTRQENAVLFQENSEIKNEIASLRNTYAQAVSSGDYHRLDSFFAKLKIPQNVILEYAHAKVKLLEATPEERNAVEGRLRVEREREYLAEQQGALNQTINAQSQEMKQQAFNYVMSQPDINELEQMFDERTGKQGAFRQAVVQAGIVAWHTEKKDISPKEAVDRVIENYHLKAENPMLPPKQGVAPASQPGQKTVVKKQASVIPNIGASGSASPMKAKPKSVEDLKKLYNDKYVNT